MTCSAPKIGEICWTELATGNAQAAKEFYGQVFGWKFEDHDMDDMTYTMIKVNDREFGGIWSIPEDKAQEIPPHWMSYVYVENLEKSLESVKKNGGSVLKPPANVGMMGRFAIITDPTGAHIALWQILQK